MPARPRIPPALWAAFIAIDLAIIGAVLAAIFWVAPVPAALARSGTLAQARAAHPSGLTVAVVTADWCLACQMYKRGALGDERVAQWLAENAGSVLLVHGQDDADIAALGVSGVPATVVTLGDATMAAHIGLMSADELLEFLKTQAARVPEFQRDLPASGEGEDDDLPEAPDVPAGG
jgi:hypothetical protein